MKLIAWVIYKSLWLLFEMVFIVTAAIFITLPIIIVIDVGSLLLGSESPRKTMKQF